MYSTEHIRAKIGLKSNLLSPIVGPVLF